MVGFTLDDLEKAEPSRGQRQPRSSFTLEDLERSGEQETRTVTSRALDRALREVHDFGRDLKSGLYSGLAGLDADTANLFMLLDRASTYISESTGLSRGGAFQAIEEYYRAEAKELQRRATKASSGREGVPAELTRILGSLPVGLSEAGAAVALAGPVAGFASLGALSSADQGPTASAISALEGATVGKLFRITEGLSPASRAATVGTGATTAAAASGSSPKEATYSGGVAGALAAFGGKRPRTVEDLSKQRAESKRAEVERRTAQERRIETASPKSESRPLVEILPPESPRAVELATQGKPTGQVGGKVVNLNLDRIQGPNEYKQVQARLTELFRDQIDDARRGRIKLEQTKQAAEELGLSFEELTKRHRGQALNAEEITAFRYMNQSILTELVNTAKRVRDPVLGTESDKVNLIRLTQLFEVSSAQTLGATAEAGRALSALRIPAGPRSRQLEHVRELIRGFEHSTRGQEIEQFADMISTLEGSRGLSKFVRETREVKTSDKLLELWINGLLSGPQTQAVNILSNNMVALWSIPEAFTAGGVGAFRSGLAHLQGRPAPERVFLREADARLFGLIQAIPDGLRVAGRVLRTETPSDTFSKIEVARHQAITGFKGKVVRAPGRFLMSTDEFFKTIAFRQEIQGRAARQASMEGLRGRRWRERVVQLTRNPTEEMRDAAVHHAREQTFTERLGRVGSAVSSFSNAHPLAKLIFPFVRTPTNIFKFSLKRSPFAPVLSEVRANLRKGGAARDTELGRIGFGTALGIWMMYQAAQGNITGAGPHNPELRAAWLASGRRPYSFRVGDRWVSYARTEPLGTLVGIGADFAEISGHIDDHEKRDEIAAQLVFAFNRNIRNKTYLTGVTSAALALADPINYGDDFTRRLAGSVVPAAVAQYNRTQDPILRDVQSVLDQIKSRLPAYSTTLPPRRNIWGEPIFLDGGVGPDFISPVWSNRIAPDLASEEVVRVGAKLGRPKRTIQDIELTPKEYDALARITGQLAKKATDRVVRSEAYRQASDAVKREMLESIYAVARDSARTEVFLAIAHQDRGRVLKPVLRTLDELRGSEAQRGSE